MSVCFGWCSRLLFQFLQDQQHVEIFIFNQTGVECLVNYLNAGISIVSDIQINGHKPCTVIKDLLVLHIIF